jgi:ABC-type multidrug transport system ATPase subunit
MGKIIVTVNLTKCFGETRAADNVSIPLNKGEIYGFPGLNGAGKSPFFLSLISNFVLFYLQNTGDIYENHTLHR